MKTHVLLERGEFTINLDLPVEGSLALAGVSGSGKSSVLRALAGLESDAQVTGALQVDPGYLGQVDGLFPHMSALDNVAYPLRADGARRAVRRDRAAALLERLDLGALADQRPGRLSGGQRRRVGVARALAAPRDLYLLDEPFAGLDAVAADLTERLIADEFRASGAPAVVAGHELPRLRRICDRVAYIERGALADPHEVAAPGFSITVDSAASGRVRAAARSPRSTAGRPADCRGDSR